ncbi:Ferritin heavy chain [Lemmus lemmus]
MPTQSPSQVAQNYHQNAKTAKDLQITLELYAFNVSLSISCYFDQDVVLKNFAKWFQCHEEKLRS